MFKGDCHRFLLRKRGRKEANTDEKKGNIEEDEEEEEGEEEVEDREGGKVGEFLC